MQHPPSEGLQGEERLRIVGMSAVAAAMHASNPEEAVATIRTSDDQVMEFYKVPLAAELVIKIVICPTRPRWHSKLAGQ